MKIRYSSKPLVLAAFVAGTLAAFGAEVREEFHQTYKLDKAGVVGLDNVNGSVHISTWDRDEVKVDAIKRAKKQEHLDEVTIDVQATTDRIQIKSKYPKGEHKNISTSVDYTLTVPRDCNLKKINTVNGGVDIKGVHGDVEANSVNGAVAAEGLTGEVEMATVNGSVKATLIGLRSDVSLSSVNGSVTAAFPANANAEVSASTVNGGISCDFPITIKKSFPVGQKIEGKIGEGGPHVKLSAVNGGIHIDKAKGTSAEEE